MPHPALEWAASGGMHLTGWPAMPLVPSVDVLGAAQAWADDVKTATAVWGKAVRVDVPAILFGRAALAGGQRAGRTSVGGTCRLLRATDGWIAVNLARPEDVDAVPALVGDDIVGDPWNVVTQAVTASAAADVADRAQLLGIPAAVLARTTRKTSPRLVESAVPPRSILDSRNLERFSGGEGRPLVVDFSAMWAGPLCTRLLTDAGAHVVKVESVHRPDGARAGDAAFYDWLHAGQESVAVDFTDSADLRLLHDLVDRADVVVEASRPRALRQLGIDRERVVAARPGVTWVSITGYGDERVAFGDDAAVAGGLVAYDAGSEPVFCADAIADPLTGLSAAAAAASSIAAGGRQLISVAMADVAGSAKPMPGGFETENVDGRWVVRAGGAAQEVLAPQPPRAPAPAAARAPAMGADNERVLGTVTTRR